MKSKTTETMVIDDEKIMSIVKLNLTGGEFKKEEVRKSERKYRKWKKIRGKQKKS